MLVYDHSNDAGLLLTLPPPAPGTPARSPGVHVSTLVHLAALDMGLYDPTDPDDAAPGQRYPQPAINRMCLGLAWEEWLQRRYAGRLVFHPGELAADGVAGSPDAVETAVAGYPTLPLHEFKCSWKSCNKPIAHAWAWWAQLMAYTYMLHRPAIVAGGAMATFTGWLHVYHVMGDYRGSGPQYRVYRATFTSRELLETWTALMQYRRAAETETNH